MKNDLRKRVDAFTGRCRKEDINLHGFILSVRGQEKVKAYYAPFREGAPHRMYSVSKTTEGTLWQEGRVRGPSWGTRYRESAG